MRSAPRGAVYAACDTFLLRRDPCTFVGIDVAYVSAELRAATPKGSQQIDGVPLLAVEILSPSNKQGDVAEKVEECLDVGVGQVWVANPDFQTLTFYRSAAELR